MSVRPMEITLEEEDEVSLEEVELVSMGEEDIVSLQEEDKVNMNNKRRRLEQEGGGRRAQMMTRSELEELVESKILELLQFRGQHVELGKRVGRLTEENTKLKELASQLGKQVADLQEVTRRVKVLEKEGKGVRIPKITRSVGLQVNSKPAPHVTSLAPSPAPPGASPAPLLHPSFHNPLGQTNPSRRRPQGATISPLPAPSDPASAGPSHPASARFVANYPAAASFVANLGEPAQFVANSPAPTIPTHRPSMTAPAPSPATPAPKPQLPEEITLDDDDEAALGGVAVGGRQEGVATPLQLVVNRALAGGAGIVVQWNKRSIGAMFDFSQVRGYELEGSQGNSAKWSKVGPSIKPLTLPMACNLNGFKLGETYSFRIKLLTGVSACFSNIATIKL